MIAVHRWLMVIAVGCLVALPNWCLAQDDPQDALKKAQEALKKVQQLQTQNFRGNAVLGNVQTLARSKKTGAWKTIDWQKTMKEAVEKAQAENKPIFVFMNVNKMGQPNAGRYCEGSQATLDYPLSDEKVIAKLGKDFVAVHLNLTDQGFPKEAEGLKEIERAFKQSLVAHYAFSLSAVLTPDGKQVLGQSRPLGGSTIENFLMPNCLTFLEDNLERHRKTAAK
jgi:hypothetical protein